jgi:hypothetical protein
MRATSTRNAPSLMIGTVAGCLLLFLGCWPLRASANARVSTLESLEPGMTRDEVVALVGEPDEECEVVEPWPLTFGHWTFHTTPFTGHQLGIAFEGGRAAKIVFGNSLAEDLCEVLAAAILAPREPQPPAPPEPVSADAPGPTFDSAYLFGRLSELGAGVVAPGPSAMDLFDRIPIAGTEDQVNALLGPPTSAPEDGGQPHTMTWAWEDGTVRVRYRAGVAREKQWIGAGWRIGVVGDVWTAETTRFSIRASNRSGA